MILIFLLVNSITFSPEYFTNTNYIYEIECGDSTLYCATSGGLMSWERNTTSFQVLTNTDGLPSNKQVCLTLDANGYLWCGGDMGLALTALDFSDVIVFPNTLLSNIKIQELVCSSDSIYIGTAGGLMRFDTRGTPTDFDDDVRLYIYTEDGLPSNDITSIFVEDTVIWIGTGDGLVKFQKDFSNPIIFDVDQGLLSNHINKVTVLRDTVYVATPLGFQSFKGDHFDTLLEVSGINDIVAIGDSLFITLNPDSQVGVFYNGNLSCIKSGLPWKCDILDLLTVNNELFCGLGDWHAIDHYGQGIGEYDFSDQNWAIIQRSCLPSNHISEIAAHPEGIFIAHGARGNDSRGIGWLKNDGSWVNYARDSIIPVKRIHRCTIAPDGKLWFGVNPILLDTAVISFNPSTFEWGFIPNGYQGMSEATAVWDIEIDNSGNIYLTLAGADELWVIDSNLTNIARLDYGREASGFFVEIALDSSGRIWRTEVDGGISMLDTKNTLFDLSDDENYAYSEGDGLVSIYTRGCLVGANSHLYVTSIDGLAQYDSVFTTVNGFQDKDLFDLELDSQDRVWILGREGIYYFDPRLKAWDEFRFSRDNINIEFIESLNEMVQVQGFEFDPYRECFWLGGETGLLKLEIQLDTVISPDSIIIYPNPVLEHDVVKIKNIPADALVNIYSISGRLLVEGLEPDHTFREVTWNIPANIGSGLYYVLVRTAQGDKVCKFAIVR